MKGRNPNLGRRSMGAPIAKSGIKPPVRTGSPSGSGVGTGVNVKTIGRQEMASSRDSKSGALGPSSAGESWVKQAPEPFRNPSFGAAPTVPATKESGATGTPAYTGKGGNRISTAEQGKSYQAPLAAVGISGKAGRGSENRKVIGRNVSAPRGGPFVNVPGSKSKKPSFYGR